MPGWTETNIVESGSKTLEITLLGDPGGGKTSLTKQLVGKGFDIDEQITVGADFTFYNPKTLPDLKLKICDIAGQASFSTVRHNYLVKSDAALLIFDITNPDSFENVEGWMREYIEANKQKERPTPILLVGNKSDLDDQRRVSLKSIQQFLQLAEEKLTLADHIIGYIETSAKTGENVEKCFNKVTSQALQIAN